MAAILSTLLAAKAADEVLVKPGRDAAASAKKDIANQAKIAEDDLAAQKEKEQEDALEAGTVSQNRRRARKARSQSRSTLLTSPLGVTTSANTASKTLLGA